MPSSTAHPRAGGENDPSSLSSTGLFGSSPRGRGKPVWAQQRRQMQRLIPARAGKTPCRARAHSCVSAHPRVGGENIDSWELPERHVGSSPRRRGKHSRRLPRPYGGGLIPAWAGKTRPTCTARSARGAHPRVGGENTTVYRDGIKAAGSSPRGRGKQHIDSYPSSMEGLIPAWAGKTSWSRPPTLTARAHPRVGGENNPSPTDSTAHPGSSPRGRGKHPHDRRLRRELGLIPAWAGKTRSIPCRARPTGAHPRVGGENTTDAAMKSRATGSSPRGRGKRVTHRIDVVSDGLIPAWAGKTTPPIGRPRRRGAHPRVGGENSTPKKFPSKFPGSSPRRRGKRSRS